MNPLYHQQGIWASFHSSDHDFTNKPHSPLSKIHGYPESQMLVEILLPSNQCHMPNLRIPRNAALMLSSGYLLDMLVRWYPMIFLLISESTTARSLPCCKQDSRALFHSVATEVLANTRKHESSTSNQPESHVDPVKPITKGNSLHWVSLSFFLSQPYSMILAVRKRYFTDYISSWIFVSVHAKQTFPFLFLR